MKNAQFSNDERNLTMNLKKIIFIACILVMAHNNSGYAMDQCPFTFPQNTEIRIYSFTFEVQRDSPEALIKSIKKLCKLRKTCKYFNNTISDNIAACLTLDLERHGLKITDILDRSNHSVLHAACIEKIDAPILATILLQASGNDALPLIEIKDRTNCTALFYATREKNIETIKILLASSGKQAPSIVLMLIGRKNHITALGHAVRGDDIEIVKTLLDAAGVQALPEIIVLQPDAETLVGIGHTLLENGIAGSQEMVDLLQHYRKKYENIDVLCESFDSSLVLEK